MIPKTNKLMVEIRVILVDENDIQIGTMEKIGAHKKALLHRAVSVFICNSKGEWLIQRRALNKYHSGGLWTNASCTHPYPDETSINAAYRRLMEEMGMECKLKELFCFTYKENLDNEITEFEFDHVFWGVSDQIPEPNNDEVMEYKYISYKDMLSDIKLNSENYTVWFKKIFKRVNIHIKNDL